MRVVIGVDKGSSLSIAAVTKRTYNTERDGKHCHMWWRSGETHIIERESCQQCGVEDVQVGSNFMNMESCRTGIHIQLYAKWWMGIRVLSSLELV